MTLDQRETQLHARVGRSELRLGARDEDELETGGLTARNHIDGRAVRRERFVEERKALVGAGLTAGRDGQGVPVVPTGGERRDVRRARSGWVRESGSEHSVEKHVARKARESLRKSSRDGGGHVVGRRGERGGGEARPLERAQVRVLPV